MIIHDNCKLMLKGNNTRKLPYKQIINPQRACARVIVVTFSVCLCVYVYVCVCLSVSQTDFEDVFPNGHHSTARGDIKFINVAF